MISLLQQDDPMPILPENEQWLNEVPPEDLRRVVGVLHRVHGFIAAITDLDTLLERVMEESKEVAQAEACSLMLYDEPLQQLYFHVALGEEGDQQLLKREIRLSIDEGIAGAAAKTRQSISVEDVRADSRFYRAADERTHFETRSILAVPLLDHDELIGVVEVLNKRGGGAFSEADLRVMEIFCSLVAAAIANARLIEENVRRERLAAIGEAVAGLSHFTKNIITGMSGGIDLIDRAIRLDDKAALERSWPVLKRSTARIANLVEDMLAFCKPRAPHREKTALQPLLREVVETFQATLAKRSVDIHMDTEEASSFAEVDQRGVYRCLMNLLANAADAAPAEGGKIWLVARELPSGALEIVVADNGPGVPEHLLYKVRQPFFSTKGTQGTGLGLAVTSKIMDEHGGRLDIENRPEGGALMRLLFSRLSRRKSDPSEEEISIYGEGEEEQG
jgi:signal transduction histidine kinase